MTTTDFGWNYPASLEHDPRAPWNQRDPEPCDVCGEEDTPGHVCIPQTPDDILEAAYQVQRQIKARGIGGMARHNIDQVVAGLERLTKQAARD